MIRSSQAAKAQRRREFGFMTKLLTCIVFAAVVVAAGRQSAAHDRTVADATRNFGSPPPPRSTRVGPSPGHSQRPGQLPTGKAGRHGSQAGYGRKPPPYNQPYISIDSATMQRLLATPPPPTPTQRPAAGPTPTVFFQINNRP
jgi:hypothetical protein